MDKSRKLAEPYFAYDEDVNMTHVRWKYGVPYFANDIGTDIGTGDAAASRGVYFIFEIIYLM